MKEVVDRIVQYPNRYKLTDVSTGQEMGTYDFTEIPGTVQQEGTEINAELFESIEQDISKSGLISIKTALNQNIPSDVLAGVVANPQNYVVVSSSASNTPGFYVGRSGNTLMYRNNNIAFSGGQTIGIEFNIDTTTGRLTNTMFTLVSKAGEGYGTVNPTSKTGEMTEPVGVDANGALWAKSNGESFDSSGTYPNLTAGEATHAQSADTATSAASATDAVNAQIAVKATQDAAGNNIQSTYATKTELNTKANQTALDGVINGTTPVAKATTADSATNATHATVADSATSATSATNATNATNDGQGRDIASTYALKSEVGTKKYLHLVNMSTDSVDGETKYAGIAKIINNSSAPFTVETLQQFLDGKSVEARGSFAYYKQPLDYIYDAFSIEGDGDSFIVYGGLRAVHNPKYEASGGYIADDRTIPYSRIYSYSFRDDVTEL